MMPSKSNMPTKKTCYELFEESNTPENVVKHCKAVNEVAVFLASRLRKHGIDINVELVDKASLLHDLARVHSNHAKKGATILREEGFPDIARIIEKHRYDTIGTGKLRTWEEKVVYYADKRAIQHIVSVEERTQRWMERYPEHAEEIKAKLPLVKELEQEIFEPLEIKPEGLRREIKAFL